jgi:hypothetical protein
VDTLNPVVAPLLPFVTNSAREVVANAVDASQLTFVWEKISGPGNIIFSAAEKSTTKIAADLDGDYEVQFTATDAGGLAGSGTLKFTWDTLPPAVDVGVDVAGPENTVIKTAEISDATALSLAWTISTGADLAVIENTKAATATAHFSGDGMISIRLTATDAAGNVAFDEFVVSRNSAAAEVSAGADIVIATNPMLLATVDDGIGVSYQWSQISGPGTVTYTNPTSLASTAMASQDGVYILRIATDKLGARSSDDVTFTLDSSLPLVNVGIDLATNAAFIVTGSATDLTALTYAWSQTSGPGVANFSVPNSLSTSITADLPGNYVLRLTATDVLGHIQFDELNLNWDATSPLVNVGSDFSNVTSVVSINATASDSSAMTYQWSKVSGPGSIIFGTPNAEDSTAHASTAGIYVLRLTVTDALGNVAYDELNLDWTKFSYSWNFNVLSDYIYDSGKIEFINSAAQLLPVNAIPKIESEAQFTETGHASSNVEWNAGSSAMQLSAGGLTTQTGTYTSPVYDFGSSVTVSQLSWENIIPGPFQRDLPGNGVSDPAGWNGEGIQNMSGLMLLFHFNEATGTSSLVDGSGNLKSDTTAMVAACSGAQCPALNNRGRIGRGAVFNGYNDLVIADDPANRIDGDFAISAWINNDVVSGYRYIIEKGNNDACDNYALLITDGRMAFEYSKDVGSLGTCTGSATSVQESSAPMSVGVWYHIAVVYDSTASNFTFYRDGVVTSQSLGVTDHPKASTQSVYIGRQNFGGNTMRFVGSIDELAVFSRQVTMQEIRQMYRRGLYRLDFSLRLCPDSTCSTAPAWVGPDGGVNSRFYTSFQSDDAAINALSITGIGASRYMQYKASFNSPDHLISPKLNSMTIGAVSQNNPTVQVAASPKSYTSLTSFTENVAPGHIGDVTYQLSPNGTNWYYFNGTTWVVTDSGFSASNFATTVHANISSFTAVAGQGSLYFRAYLNKDPGSGIIKWKGITITGTQTN